jgi:predicted kinase
VDAGPSLLVLTGPAGAGKTTVARRLAETSSERAVHLHTDDYFAAIKAGYIAPWLPESAAQNETVTRAILGAASAFATDGFFVVIDGIVGPFRLAVYRAEAARLGLGLDYVVLRPSRATAVVRARDRVDSPLADYPPNLFDMFENLGPLEANVVDSEVADPAALVEAVGRGVAAGRFRLA